MPQSASRRSFLLAAGAGAVTTVAATPLLSSAAAEAASPAATSTLTSSDSAASAPRAMAFVKDARKGTLGIYVGEREIELHDPVAVKAILTAISTA